MIIRKLIMRNNKFEENDRNKPYEVMAEDLIIEMRTQAEFEFDTSIVNVKELKDLPKEPLEMLKHVFTSGTLFGYMKTIEKLAIKLNIIL